MLLNNQQHAALDTIFQKTDHAMELLEDFQMEQQKELSQMPEKMAGTSLYEMKYELCELLENADKSLKESISYLQRAQSLE